MFDRNPAAAHAYNRRGRGGASRPAGSGVGRAPGRPVARWPEAAAGESSLGRGCLLQQTAARTWTSAQSAAMFTGSPPTLAGWWTSLRRRMRAAAPGCTGVAASAESTDARRPLFDGQSYPAESLPDARALGRPPGESSVPQTPVRARPLRRPLRQPLRRPLATGRPPLYGPVSAASAAAPQSACPASAAAYSAPAPRTNIRPSRHALY
ncbi:uncharacterized protein V1510DRAFT_416608, partial [Dipodascopsis tothii]|uniref:uncharacterized protein n=1 Tax=Dipodascopsis tothii TaxID=44089 RepID=UPI0034CDB28D